MPHLWLPSRRKFLSASAFLSAAMVTPGLLAEELTLTPAQTPGPFYPEKLPLDTDNDLIIINDSLTPAVGEITYLSGKLMDNRGNPVRNATVEIWQVDHNGAYLHEGSANRENQDKNFQGFGRFHTGLGGEYLFRTVKPVPYPGRTPHIHVKVVRPGQRDFVTQCYINGHPGNARDGILQRLGSQEKIDSVLVDFKPVEGSRAGELSARFDIVLGVTAEDPS